jgi:methylamine dehydrogenase light chain
MNPLARFDRLFERGSRQLAHRSARRGFLGSVSRVLVGSAFALPVLPFDRSAGARAAQAAGSTAPRKPGGQDCDYWRYCSVDGFLCSCCGGSATSCPPGATPSVVSWVGTCHNPDDGRDYLVSYTDCCGRTTCGRCFCNNNVGEKPGYRMGVHNDVNWCMANAESAYHCTLSVIVGVAE